MSSESEEAVEQRPVWAWIDRDALAHNARRALALAEGREVIGVVKADGYGHGAPAVARVLVEAGIPRLAVVSIAEGAALRRAGIEVPILQLGGFDDPAAPARARKWGLTPVLQDLRGVRWARSVGSAADPYGVEVEIDSGMARMGAAASQVDALLEAIESAPELRLNAVFTHLARAEEKDPAPSRAQRERLREVCSRFVQRFRKEVPSPWIESHFANSGGLLRRAEIEGPDEPLATTAVRPGLMLYGVSPMALAGVPDGGPQTAEGLGLEPVMTLAARVVAVRDIEAGTAVGYGGEWRAPRATQIATLPLGYADGIPRSAFGRGQIHLAGAMRPIVGRVSMDSVCVDVGSDPVRVGEVATAFGRTPEGERIPVEALAEAAGTVGYELLVGVGARVPRRLGHGPPPAAGADLDGGA